MSLAISDQIETRRCYDCGLVKLISEFAFQNKSKGTRQSRCRPCHAAYRRGHYLRNRGEYIAREVERIRQRREENRPRVREYLRAHPCVDCGETDILTLQFGHRERATKRKEVAILVLTRTWRVVMAEIAKCDVRCANCHRRRTAAQLRWRSLAPATPAVIGAMNFSESIEFVVQEFRECTGCGETKPITEFHYRDRAHGLRRRRCRSCMRAYGREHYQRNKLRYATGDWGRKRCDRTALDADLDAYLGGHPCVDCGESDPRVLDFDHRDGVEKLETVAWLRARGRRETLFQEIEKCEVRCANCHQRRTARQFGWTKLLEV